MQLTIAILLGIGWLCVVGASVNPNNLLLNPHFENTNFTGSWYCMGGCTVSSSTIKYGAQRSIKVSHRQHDWAGLAQDVHVRPGHRYTFSAYIQLLNMPAGSLYQSAGVKLKCLDGNGKVHHSDIGTVPFMEKSGRWVEVGGIVAIQHGYHSCSVHLRVGQMAVNYVVDHASLFEVHPDPNWRVAANQRIDQLRKANVTITVTGLNGNQNGNDSVEIELVQTSHEFGFGSCVDAKLMMNDSYQPYQDAFVKNFEWGVLSNALKWRQTEWTKDHFDYDTPMAAIYKLRELGIKLRAHNIFWDIEQYIPNWVLHLHGQPLREAIHNRTVGVVGQTNGFVEHWDVNNENLHGDFYENKTHDRNITMEMFKEAHAVDPLVKLFLNEYNVVSGTGRTFALKDQALEFKRAGVPIYGVGIQSHVTGHQDITLTAARLNKVAEAGLPIWITELTVDEANVTQRAQKLSDLMTLYFSHPSVKGIVLWGFWDGRIWIPNSALFEGPQVTPNEAGNAFLALMAKWRTHETHTITGDTSMSMRGFKGEYTVNVRHQGQLVKTETFTLEKNGQTLTIDLSGLTSSPNVAQTVVG